jgi:hypothetical protein
MDFLNEKNTNFNKKKHEGLIDTYNKKFIYKKIKIKLINHFREIWESIDGSTQLVLAKIIIENRMVLR